MPREACRIVLEVVEVRLERLQDITEEGAIASGVKHFDKLPNIHPWGQDPRWSMEEPVSTEECLGTARFAYANWWNKQSFAKEYHWCDNPYVWVYEIKAAKINKEEA